MNKQTFAERCSLCQAVLPFVDHRQAVCDNGHMWPRSEHRLLLFVWVCLKGSVELLFISCFSLKPSLTDYLLSESDNLTAHRLDIYPEPSVTFLEISSVRIFCRRRLCWCSSVPVSRTSALLPPNF